MRLPGGLAALAMKATMGFFMPAAYSAADYSCISGNNTDIMTGHKT
jgi:hypothetical protein